MEVYELFDYFGVKLHYICIEKLQLSLQNAYWTMDSRIQLFNNSEFKSWKVYENCVEKPKTVEKSEFFEFHGSFWLFIQKNCLYLPEQPYWTTTSFVVERFPRSD